MSLKLAVRRYLENDKRFRERKNKDKGIANMINRKYHNLIPKDKRADIVGDILTADRSWRGILKEEENKHLRGKDYNDKVRLSQEAQIGLGYEAFYNQDIKK